MKNEKLPASKDIVGVWRIIKIARQGSNRKITDKPFPNIFMFTPLHYCMAWVLNPNAEKPFAQRWNPTDEEKINRFDSMVINSGTYEIDGSVLTAHPIVARIPDFVGGKLICEYALEGNTMHLKFIDEYSFDGVQAPWVASDGLVLTLERIE
ncbi:MAG: lipocalin-like domain-containing protein [candidate division WOR-3 bacterium]|nr:MAG: lipocalin-like domain-containing protein [candidate division WOR-3 bacterium]